MFSYYSLIKNSTKFVRSKTIFPQDIAHISFMQFVKTNHRKHVVDSIQTLDSEKFLNIDKVPSTNDSLYRFTKRRQDFILLNKGKMQIDLIDKNFNKRSNVLLSENSLICNDKKLIDGPSLFNIGASVYYNIKALPDSEFLFYSSDYCNTGDNVKFDYYKFDDTYNNCTKYLQEEYPYFDFMVKEKDLVA